MFDDPKSKINQLEKILDGREDKVSKKMGRRHDLHDHPNSVPQDWDDEAGTTEKASSARTPAYEIKQTETFTGSSTNLDPESRSKHGWPMKILFGSIGFFVLAILAVIYKIFFGGIIVSGDNIEISVKAPVSVSGGEVLPIEIEVRNNNNVSLIAADLGVTFPSGTMNANNISEPVKRNQLFLGDIAPGKSVKKNFRVVMFGSESEKKNIDLILEYKVTGSNSLFNKTRQVPILISTAPVSLVVTGPSDVNTNQTVNFNVEVTSNSTTVIKNLLLSASYPFGFSFISSSPNTYNKNNLWLIGDLAPGEKRNIKITGNLTGQEGEERGFNFTLGNQSKADATLVETPFNTAFSSITIRRPFVSADLFFGGTSAPEYVASAGEKVEGIIQWQNNLAYQVSDVSIVVKLSGNALDKSSVTAEGGFYRSIDNTIIFDKTTDSVFAKLEPGQSGESKIQFKSFSPSSGTGSLLTNPTITLALSAEGAIVGASGPSQTVKFSDSRKVKITSAPSLMAKALYYVGPFQNTGPIPPKAEVETTYTITWTVTNPLNSISGARVVAVLPPYVKWLDKVSPSLEKLVYDKGTGQVTWNIGNVSAGAGRISAAKEVSFQISVQPSVSQIDTSPDLVEKATLTAKDVFTGINVSSDANNLNTFLGSDPYFKADSEKVIK
jgi:hypothetical protein